MNITSEESSPLEAARKLLQEKGWTPDMVLPYSAAVSLVQIAIERRVELVTERLPKGFTREELQDVLDSYSGAELTVNVGNVTGEGDEHIESTDGFIVRLLTALLKPLPTANQTTEPMAKQWRPLVTCAAGRDGDCNHPDCPQNRDGEPMKSGRNCPLDFCPACGQRGCEGDENCEALGREDQGNG